MQLRQAVLSRELFKDSPATTAGSIRAVVFEWHVGNGVASLVTFEDGSTSIYLSTGGGVIGAGEHESVRRASTTFRNEAARALSHFRPTGEFPPPAAEAAGFYIVTDSATLSSGHLQSVELQKADHPLSVLAQAAQAVITAVREAS